MSRSLMKSVVTRPFAAAMAIAVHRLNHRHSNRRWVPVRVREIEDQHIGIYYDQEFP